MLSTTASPIDLFSITKEQLHPVVDSNSSEEKEQYLSHEKLIEGLCLMMLAVIGIILNVVIIGIVCIRKKLRQFMNTFVVHSCILDALKSAACVLFALGLLNAPTRVYCVNLAPYYIVSLTVGMFNLLAMVLGEAYTFHVHNFNEFDRDRRGTMACVLFTLSMIYMGSIILHLGPTLIAGQVQFNQETGSCEFAYGQIQNYIGHVIWIVIVSITLTVILSYIYKFYRQLSENERYRITNLVRNAAALSRGNTTTDIYERIHELKRRVRLLLLVALIYMICWYPLFTLTLVDVFYTKPKYMYRILTVVAWSHSTIVPLMLLCLDKSYGISSACKAMSAHNSAHAKRSASKQPLASSFNECAANSVHSNLQQQGKPLVDWNSTQEHNGAFNNNGAKCSLLAETQTLNKSTIKNRANQIIEFEVTEDFWEESIC